VNALTTFTFCRDHSRQLRVNSDELQARKDRLVELQTTCKMTQYVMHIFYIPKKHPQHFARCAIDAAYICS